MLLLTKAIRKALPSLYAQEKEGDGATGHVKFFGGSWTWFATEATAYVSVDATGEENDPVEMSLKEIDDRGWSDLFKTPTLPSYSMDTNGDKFVTLHDVRFFGLVDGLDRELGYFSLKELMEVRFPPFGLRIERDRYFTPQTLAEIKEKLGRRMTV